MRLSSVLLLLGLHLLLRTGYESWLAGRRPAAPPPAPGPSNWTGGTYDSEALQRLQNRVLDMFYHGYGSYMAHAFPHDDLKPLSLSYTDSLGELGTDGSHKPGADYGGVAMTLIDSLSTLAVLGNASEFERNVRWLTENLSFDQDVRVNVFEANIRLLGGLLSAHLLAADPRLGPALVPGGYGGGLLDLAYSLALRLLPAFLESPTGLPYAWINLRHGLEGSKAVTETNVAACGSLILEMATLSRLTGNPVFEDAAVRALERLWAMRSPRGLLGSSLDMEKGVWRDASGGIGASSDSFFEYLLKAYILLGEDVYWHAFSEAYTAALRHYKLGPWYHDAHYATGHPTHLQFTALQAFWPGMQVLAGDVLQAADTFERFIQVWLRFGVLPERYLFPSEQLHPTEQSYPLRPELIESNTYLFQATRDPRYLANGERFMDSLYRHSWAPGGWASIRSVATHEREDHMHSFFLAETCKYLFLLYNDTFLQEGNWVFTTEGHPLPVTALSQGMRPPSEAAAAAAAAVSPGKATAAVLAGHPFYRQRAPQNGSAADALAWTHQLVAQRRLAAAAAEAEAGTCATQGPPDTPLPLPLPLQPQPQPSQQPNASLAAAEREQPDASPAGTAAEAGAEQPKASTAAAAEGKQPEACSAAEAGAEQPDASPAAAAEEEGGKAFVTALAARVCPWYGKVPVGSLCHVPDRHEDHRCASEADCGVDAGSCRRRVCTQHSHCATVVALPRGIPDLASLLLGAQPVNADSADDSADESGDESGNESG